MWGDTVNDESLGKVGQPVDHTEQTKKQKEERERLLDICATVGDGTTNKSEADYKRRYEVAKKMASDKAAELQRQGLDPKSGNGGITFPATGGLKTGNNFSSMVNAAQDEVQKDAKQMGGGGLFNQSFIKSVQEESAASETAPKTPSANTADGSFIGAATFEGTKQGYVFTTGEHGSGYYRDQSSKSSESSKSSKSSDEQPPALFGMASEEIVAKLAAATPTASKNNNDEHEGQKKKNNADAAPEMAVCAATDMEELD